MQSHESITLQWSNHQLLGTVPLTGSKSEYNRALIIQALSGGAVKLENHSDADDTRILTEALTLVSEKRTTKDAVQDELLIDVGPAGTAMRFLCAYLSITPGTYLLKGTERMHQRPIGILVEALKTLGAQIEYLGADGYPPLRIQGGFKQRTDVVEIAGDVSSQYLSALLMIAPNLPQGLTLEILGKLTSTPYLQMTLDMMKQAGIVYNWEEHRIRIEPQPYQNCVLSIEPDWSAASYWYSILALAEDGELLLPGLRPNSLQADREIVQLMKPFGVHTTFADQGVFLRKVGLHTDAPEIIDFSNCPDIAQTVIVCAAGLRKNIRCRGLHTLKIKETDRIHALQVELAKFGVELALDSTRSAEIGEEIYYLNASHFRAGEVAIDTYEDHRMAMSFAPLSIIQPGLRIHDSQVVVKSYPNFWLHLSEMGCTIKN